MKRFIKIIAPVLCLLLVLSGCGVVGDGVGISRGIGNLVITSAGEAGVDLTGLSMTLESAEQDGVAGVRLALNAIGGSPAEIIATVEGEQVVLSIHGKENSSVYVIEDAEFAETVNSLVQGLRPTTAQPEDVELSEEELEQMQAELEAQLEEMMSGYTDEELAQMEAQSQQMSELMEECFVPAGEKEIDGVTYSITEINVSYEQLVEILNQYGGESSKLGQSLDGLGAEVSIAGEMGFTEDGKGYADADLIITSPEGEVATAHMGVDATDPVAVTVEIAADVDGESLCSFSLDLLAEDLENAPWLDVDTTDAYVSTTENGEQYSNELTADLTDFVTTCLDAVTGRSLEDQMGGLLADMGLDW